jgi:hypothetical protein
MPSAAELIGLGEAPRLAGTIGNVQSAKTGVGIVQVGATPITTNFTVLTVSGGNTACILPAASAGSGPYVVANASATAALVYPPSGGNINGAGANASFTIGINGVAMFWKTSLTAWVALT